MSSYHYEYELLEDLNLTVTWYNQDDEEIIKGSKLIADADEVELAASAFANDLKNNNPELFPENPDPVDFDDFESDENSEE